MKLLRTILLSCAFIAHCSFSQNVVEIPNVFTPNGDHVNDIFRIDASGFEELTCTIVNRYGATVYRFYGLNGSWDGYTHAGVKVSAGTYFVYVEVSTSDGTSATQQGVLNVFY
ncbi:MAG: gliding motility-associated C-terminal domain-containing protein [Crocinitomicaceae bacterium]